MLASLELGGETGQSMQQQQGNMKVFFRGLSVAMVPAVIIGGIPNGVFMYWLTANCFSLTQVLRVRIPWLKAALACMHACMLACLHACVYADVHAYNTYIHTIHAYIQYTRMHPNTHTQTHTHSHTHTSQVLLFRIPGLKAALGIPDVGKIMDQQAAATGLQGSTAAAAKAPPVIPETVFASRADALAGSGNKMPKGRKGAGGPKRRKMHILSSTPGGISTVSAAMAVRPCEAGRPATLPARFYGAGAVTRALARV